MLKFTDAASIPMHSKTLSYGPKGERQECKMTYRTVNIDYLPESPFRYNGASAIVAIDVIRATTSAVTAIGAGMQVFPVASVAAALKTLKRHPEAALAGEVSGNMPDGFDLSNSPVSIMEWSARKHQIILLSSSGTPLIINAATVAPTYLCCFRNIAAVTERIVDQHDHVVIIGAGSRGQFRKEDKMGCAYLASRLMDQGFLPASSEVDSFVRKWSAVEPVEAASGRSADYLRNSGQSRDLDFIINHIDDLSIAPVLFGHEIVLPPQCTILRSVLTGSKLTFIQGP